MITKLHNTCPTPHSWLLASGLIQLYMLMMAPNGVHTWALYLCPYRIDYSYLRTQTNYLVYAIWVELHALPYGLMAYGLFLSVCHIESTTRSYGSLVESLNSLHSHLLLEIFLEAKMDKTFNYLANDTNCFRLKKQHFPLRVKENHNQFMKKRRCKII